MNKDMPPTKVAGVNNAAATGAENPAERAFYTLDPAGAVEELNTDAARGLSEEEILRLGYKTTPVLGFSSLVAALEI